MIRAFGFSSAFDSESTANMIIIRPASLDDQISIRAVEDAATATLRQVYRPNQRAFTNRAQAHIHLHRLVAISENRVVGTVRYHVADQAVNIIGLGVHADFRRRGVARCLLEFLVEIGRREKATRLRLHTIQQTGNVEVFKRLGFTVIAEREDEFAESDRFEKLIDVQMERQIP